MHDVTAERPDGDPAKPQGDMFSTLRLPTYVL